MAKAKKKRKFWNVKMPLIDHTTQLYGYGPEDLKGRIVKFDLTRFLKGKSRMLQSEVALGGEDSKEPYTIPVKITLMPTFIRRMVRKGTDSISDSFVVKVKDSKVIVKPILITRRKVSKAVRKALRRKMKEEIEGYVKNKSSDKILKEVLNNSLQKSLSLKLKKIYPLSLCDIREIEVKERFSPKPEKEDSSKEKKENTGEKESTKKEKTKEKKSEETNSSKDENK